MPLGLRLADRLPARLLDGMRSLRDINRHCHVSKSARVPWHVRFGSKADIGRDLISPPWGNLDRDDVVTVTPNSCVCRERQAKSGEYQYGSSRLRETPLNIICLQVEFA